MFSAMSSRYRYIYRVRDLPINWYTFCPLELHVATHDLELWLGIGNVMHPVKYFSTFAPTNPLFVSVQFHHAHKVEANLATLILGGYCRILFIVFCQCSCPLDLFLQHIFLVLCRYRLRCLVSQLF